MITYFVRVLALLSSLTCLSLSNSINSRYSYTSWCCRMPIQIRVTLVTLMSSSCGSNIAIVNGCWAKVTRKACIRWDCSSTLVYSWTRKGTFAIQIGLSILDIIQLRQIFLLFFGWGSICVWRIIGAVSGSFVSSIASCTFLWLTFLLSLLLIRLVLPVNFNTLIHISI